MTVYHMIVWFFVFSFMGYILECVVLSVENHRMVLDRGFGHGPFCIIYGFGAAFACLLLEPLAAHPFKLYLASTFMATSMELVTAYVMIRLFGEFWWDYSKKPYNYKGIICLESSIAWGFLGIFFFAVLNKTVHRMVFLLPEEVQKYLALSLLVFYLADFMYCVHIRMNAEQTVQEDGEKKEVIGRLKV